ncbi:adenylosuccinate lyase [Acholeplasma hippikon]|uniref:Adenylosuccinate lyase n=1 Tax=Acholeplasma hippikon TaxID=264636 RepID=A0A449BI87_9MOLU|nr:adenylosuccinate lyase [Acholeplasma hippikon]VEU82169.1 adenylosuccinate lyase/hypoxanthine phosphoribosyltransferase [Acholeplasma hippikon]
MIARYQRDIFKNIWSDQNKFDTYLKVELASSKAFHELGLIPKEDLEKLMKASFKLSDVERLEQETKHDIVAFTRAVSLSLGEEKKWFHYGLTSTDVVDTAYGVLFKEANEIIEQGLLTFMETLKSLALKYKNTPIMGRTHGMHADITSFGLKFALYYDEMNRNLERFKLARKQIEIGKISGAVGNFANIPPEIQHFVCKDLGIYEANISTQTLQRDRHAFYLQVLALIASTIEKIGVEVRHLSRTEVLEVQEGFSKTQKGSSAMPHKRNPIASENMAGIARVVRGYSLTAMENIALWHERDISHSSAERIIMPDATSLIDYMLTRYNKVLNELQVNDEKMLKNINLNHKVIYAQRVLHLLINKGLSREAAYDKVQSLSFYALSIESDFDIVLKQDKEIMRLVNLEEIDNCFTLDYYFKQVNTIYQNVGIYS